MGDTKIEWADKTWNPVTGCVEVSPGCDNCYAKTFAERWRGTPGHPFEQGFDLTLRPERLDQPMRWRKPARIFVNSMSDLFHDGIPDEFIAEVFAVMAGAWWHSFLVLTKRHGRMRSLLRSAAFREAVARAAGRRMEEGDAWLTYLLLSDQAWPLPNVWLGCSVESQQWADIRIPALRDTPAAVRWLSCEPLLEPVELGRYLVPAGAPGHCYSIDGEWWHTPGECPECRPAIDWVVLGGESGHGYRPLDLDWARRVRDDCRRAAVPFLFKQVGGRTPKAGGRELDGRTWDEYPQISSTGPAHL